MRPGPAWIACLFVCLLSARAAEARLTRAWTYAELYDAADLVVIAVPTATRARKEQAALPDIQRTDENGVTGPVMAQRVETDFRVAVVLKGKAKKTLQLHHYRELPGAGPSVNGPLLVSFDPKAKTQYLLFLVRGKDGQYVAVSGQTDPYLSIEALRDPAP